MVGYTKGDLERWETLFARSLRASGVKKGWKVHNAYGYGLFTGGLGAHYGAEKLGCTVIPMSGGQTEKQIQLIQDFEPDAILCTPTYLLTIVDAMERKGLDPRKTSLKVAVLGAEPWTEEMRHELETKLDIDACDIYGLSEVMGPGVAGECIDYKDGSTIWEDHFRPEIVDPTTDAVLADGEHGELVFTSLIKEAMPVIRYRTHDLTRLLPGTARLWAITALILYASAPALDSRRRSSAKGPSPPAAIIASRLPGSGAARSVNSVPAKKPVPPPKRQEETSPAPVVAVEVVEADFEFR